MSSEDNNNHELEAPLIHQILDTLRDISKEIDQIKDGVDRVEGRRFLFRVLSLCAENYIEGWNFDAPHFRHVINDIRKVYADSPDTDYRRANISFRHGRRYRISGIVPKTTLYWGIQLYRPRGLVGNNIPDKDCKVHPDGSFEVYLTAESKNELPDFLQGKTVLFGEGDEVAVIVRQYFLDRTKEPPLTLKIDYLGPTNENGFVGLNSNFFVRGAKLTRADLQQTLSTTLIAHDTLSQACDHKFIRGDGTRLFPTLDNRYLIAWVNGLSNYVGPNDYPAILLKGKRPRSRYFSICLYNRWLESLDYSRHIVYLNHSQMRFDSDGNFEIVISSVNPGHVNHLHTENHSGLYILSRELLPEEQEDPKFTLEMTTTKAVQQNLNPFFALHSAKL